MSFVQGKRLTYLCLLFWRGLTFRLAPGLLVCERAVQSAGATDACEFRHGHDQRRSTRCIDVFKCGSVFGCFFFSSPRRPNSEEKGEKLLRPCVTNPLITRKEHAETCERVAHGQRFESLTLVWHGSASVPDVGKKTPRLLERLSASPCALLLCVCQS